ncbi:MAG: hypothetical protein K2N06_05350 [Oscillospiraceae bacterium]|nr:hypothetical protein [Oscillospiraceae bacterium]
MDANNRFIKLLTISIGKQELILYGFSASTKQEPHPWKKKKNKLRFNVCYSILPEEEAKRFEQCLTGTDDILMEKMTLIAPSLTVRTPVLNYINGWESSGPIYRLCYVSEFRNTKKKELIDRVTAVLKASGCSYQDIHNFPSQLRTECGIDFKRNSSRFGSYERYDRPALECRLIVQVAENTTGKKVIVQKSAEWDKPLIVNCFAEGHGRVLFNRIGELLPKVSKLEFTAEESIERYTVFAWDRETREAVFFESNALIHHISVTLDTIDTPRSIHDPWSESLRSSASNKLEIIENSIESVRRRSRFDTIRIGENDPFEEAADLTCYARESAKGAFVPNEQKDGEINSFLKIKEYLDADDVCRAVLADPYFSVLSAQKLLTRITNTDLELTVITSLGSIDPDSGKEENVVEDYRKFLEDSAGVLHRKLYVYNLRRGKKPVFHDRYLIRYHKDGSTDGFLLSNSLNSMGQFYPFVIAPMDPEVCQSVDEYLREMIDPEAQEKKSEDRRVNRKVLFDYQKSVSPQARQEEPIGWEVHFREREIERADLSAILNEIQDHWEKEPEKACRVLGSLGYYTHISTNDVSAFLRKNRVMSDWYIECFTTMAKSIESSRNRYNAEIDRQELDFWMLLTGQAEPSVAGFAKLLDYPHHVWYSGINWLFSGYYLLLKLDTKRYVKLLEETCSPMMFECLLERLMFSPYTKQIYHILTKSSNKCVRLAGVCWYVNTLEYEKPKPSDVFQFLDKLKPDIRLLQLARMMSAAAFQIRVNKSLSDYWDTIFPQLPKLAVSVIPQCSPEGRKLAMDWMYDCEACSYCSLYIKLADLTSETEFLNDLLDRAIKIIKEETLRHSNPCDLTEHISLYLHCIERRYGGEAEKEMLGNLLDREAFETAVEPELKNYAYSRWHNAYFRACWQLDMLRTYSNRHPQAQRVIKLLNYWEKRIEIVEP